MNHINYLITISTILIYTNYALQELGSLCKDISPKIWVLVNSSTRSEDLIIRGKNWKISYFIIVSDPKAADPKANPG